VLPIFLVSLAAIILGGGLIIAIRTLRRRRRVWFVGEAGSLLVALTERRALVLRELRDLEHAELSGRILGPQAASMRDELTNEAVTLADQISKARTERTALERELDSMVRETGSPPADPLKKSAPTSKIHSAILAAVFSIAATSSLYAQLPGNHPPLPSNHPSMGGSAAPAAPVWPSPDSLPRNGVINVELRDKTASTSTFREAVVVVAFLPNDSIPFDELTQMEWTSGFDRIVDPHRVPSETEMALHKMPKLEGFPVNVPESGRLTVDKLPAHTRIAVAVLFQNVWWPCRSEFVFDEQFQLKTAVIDVFQVSHDMSLLQGDEWHIHAQPVPSDTDLKWLQVEMIETITITNTSPTHAVIGKAATQGGEWIRIPLTPPPGLPASEMTGGLMLDTWTWFVGKPAEIHVPFAGTAHIAPYQPWSKGLKWDGAGPMGDNNPHGGEAPARGWPAPRALSSFDNTHPHNRAGQFEFIGAGEVHVKLVETEFASLVCLIINKPIPPRSQMVIKLVQRPGIDYEEPTPIRVFRLGMPFAMPQFRVRAENTLKLLGGDALKLEAVEGMGQPFGRADVLWEASAKEGTPVIPSGKSFAWDIAPTPELIGFLKEVVEEEAKANAAAASSNPTGNSGAKTVEESTLHSGNIMWVLSALFLLATLIAAVISIRGSFERQMSRLRAIPFTRKEGLAELAELTTEYEAGRIDAMVYRDERNRILNRLAGSTVESPEAQRTSK